MGQPNEKMAEVVEPINATVEAVKPSRSKWPNRCLRPAASLRWKRSGLSLASMRIARRVALFDCSPRSCTWTVLA